MQGRPSRKRVPYISFSIERLLPFLGLIKSSGSIKKETLISRASQIFSRSKKTIQEFIISLKNLDLIEEEDGEISLTEISKELMLSSKEDFWESLRQELLKKEVVLSILDAISITSQEKKKVTSNEEYYHYLSKTLLTKYSFASASPRDLDRFITLFRKIKILDLDPLTNEYFLVRKHDIEEKALETILTQKYVTLKNEMIRRTGTSWVPIDRLRSEICRGEGIETEAVNRLLKKMVARRGFQFAEASAARREVRKGGIEKKGKIYYYLKLTE